jgi:hypothetical protein
MKSLQKGLHVIEIKFYSRFTVEILLEKQSCCNKELTTIS